MRNLLLLCLTVFSFGLAQAQDCTGADHTVLAGNLYYNPASLTITAGETIAFQNEGGTHNVNGVSSTLGDTWNNPETFSLGANSGAPGGVCMGTVTLNTPGTYQYDCSIGSHAAGGMVGTIIVEAAAATSAITFTVDVPSNITIAADGMHIAGTMNSWTGEAMTDNGDGTWSKTYDLEDGVVTFKFQNGNGGWESTADRTLTVAGADASYSACWETTLEECPGLVDVTFQVDMANAGLVGGEVIYVSGNFDGWCGNCNAMSDDDADGVYTTTLQLGMTSAYEFKYLINGWGGEEQDANLIGTSCDWVPNDAYGNRGFAVGDVPVTLPVVCYDFCGTCAEQDAENNGGGGGGASAPTDNAADPTEDPANVVSVYGGAYTSIATNLNPGWGQSGTVNGDYDPGTGNVVLEYANFNYQGTDVTATDLSSMTHLHVDVWVAEGTDRQLKVTPINNGTGTGEFLVNVPLTPGAWNSVDLAKADFTGMTWNNVFQMKFDGQFNGDGSANTAGWNVYLDNIYFWNDGSGSTGGGGGTAGCMDSDASNYNDAADTDDGSCQYDITFQVDMSQAGLVGGDIAYVNGSFNSWCGACNPLSDDDADGVWTATIPLAPGVIEYKFTINGWTAQEELGVGAACDYNPADGFANRGVEIVDAPITLDVVCYNSCEACVIGGDVNGCTDVNAANYNSAATIDDGSCTYPVTFKVDMSDYTAAYGVVNINGSFNGWCGGCNAMTAVGDNVYETTINVPADTIEYKFTLDGWTIQEEFAGGEECTSTIDGFTNRSSIITGAAVLDVVCFNSCAACENAGGGGGSTDLVATLDASCSGITEITSVRIFGPFWGWDPAAGPEATLNAEGLYEVVFSPAPEADMEYKWLINGDQEDLLDFGPDLNGDGYDDFLNADCVPITDYFSYANRQWTVGSGNIADTWSQCAPCAAGTDSVLVTITVDMSEEEVNPIGVFVAGSFQGWSPGSTIATNNGDGTWSHSFYAEPGTNVQYKWLNGTAWGFEETVPSDCQYPGDSNRGFDVPSEDYSHPVHCFGSCNACGAATYAATFTVLTDNITVAAGGMHIAGAFEGWSGTAMSDNGDGSWSITLDLEQGSYEFKFQNGLGGWEELDCGGNRSVTVDGSGAVSYTGCFAQCGESTACTVDPDPANITFRVDMSEVVDLVADSVYMIGGFTDPVWQAGAILMDDSDGDLVYEATVLVSGPTSIAYKFFNGNPFPNGVGTEVGGETADFAAGGCGVDNGVGGFNRTHDRSGTDEVLDVVCFNSCAACGGGAEGTEVTFSVDMNNYAGTFTTLNVSGTWNDFCGDCNLMSDDDMDGIWTATIALAEGENYRYKYQVDAWADQEDLAPGDNPVGPCVVKEGGFTNRDLDVVGTDAIVLDVVCWGSCLACLGQDDVPGCNDATASNYDAAATGNDGSCIYDVTLSVNMSEYALADGDTVYVNSEFNGWCGACNPMSDDDGDGVWTVTLPLTYDYYEYKFTVNAWSAEENLAGIGGCVTENFGFTNRVLQLFGNQSEPVVCWSSCSNCEGTGDIAGCTDSGAVNYAAIATVDDGSCQYNVTFQVDMANVALNPGDIVYVNGGFNGWCGACNPLSDDDADGVWTATLPLPNGDQEFKYTINGWDMQEELTVGDICDFNPADGFANRGFTLTADLVLDVVCYNSCYSCDVSTGCTDAAAQNYDADADVDDGSCAYIVTLRLDMSQQEVAAEGVHVAGSFQGWDPAGTSMTTPGLGLYEYTLQLSNGAHQFIYINGNVWDGQETVPAECGADNGLGGYNREVIVDGADMVVSVVCFSSCTACSGCTDPLSAEFSPFAGEDDGSCVTPLVFGCTYADADNYNPAANMENGSCEFTGGSSCPTDIDGDGSTAVGDLLIILGSFGQTCE